MSVAATGLAFALVAQQILAPADGGSTIRGRVFNPDGKPMADVSVIAEPLNADGLRMVGRAAQSDAEGRFELKDVPPGAVFIRARPPIAVKPRIVEHPPVYFPGVVDRLQAWSVDVGRSETIELDIHVPPVFTASIKTMVSGPEGYQLDQLRVMRASVNEVRNVKVDDHGVGYADGLREGKYAVAARARDGDTRMAAWWIGDVFHGEVEVPLGLEPTGAVNGRVVTDRGGVPPLEYVRVVAAWTLSGEDLDPLPSDRAEVSPDGTFTMEGLFGWRAFRLQGLPPGWELVAVRAGRTEVGPAGLHVTPGSTADLTLMVARK